MWLLRDGIDSSVGLIYYDRLHNKLIFLERIFFVNLQIKKKCNLVSDETNNNLDF